MSAPCIIGWGHTPFGKLDAADSEQLIRDAISGNLCRCTGYETIVDAALLAAQTLRGGA